MTREEFINKWAMDFEDMGAMEFDLISVINTECEKKITGLRFYKEIAEIEASQKEREKEQKAYTMTADEVNQIY